jgi:hypothetical protein
MSKIADDLEHASQRNDYEDAQVMRDAVSELRRLEEENAKLQSLNEQWLRRHAEASEAGRRMGDKEVRARLANEWASCIFWQEQCVLREAENIELQAENARLKAAAVRSAAPVERSEPAPP